MSRASPNLSFFCFYNGYGVVYLYMTQGELRVGSGATIIVFGSLLGIANNSGKTLKRP